MPGPRPALVAQAPSPADDPLVQEPPVRAAPPAATDAALASATPAELLAPLLGAPGLRPSGCHLPAAPPSGCAALRRLATRLPHRLDGGDQVGVLGVLVGAVALHPREPQRHAAGVAGAGLHAVEGDLHHQLGTHEHRVALAAVLDLQERLRLPGEQRVGEALERLAHHHEAAVGIAGAEVEVAQPPLPASAAPLGGQHDQVEGLDRLHLAPRPASAAGVVGAVERLHHRALVAARQRLVEERLRGRRLGRADARDGQLAHHLVEVPEAGVERLVDEVGAVAVEDVEEADEQASPRPRMRRRGRRRSWCPGTPGARRPRARRAPRRRAPRTSPAGREPRPRRRRGDR